MQKLQETKKEQVIPKHKNKRGSPLLITAH